MVGPSISPPFFPTKARRNLHKNECKIFLHDTMAVETEVTNGASSHFTLKGFDRETLLNVADNVKEGMIKFNVAQRSPWPRQVRAIFSVVSGRADQSDR